MYFYQTIDGTIYRRNFNDPNYKEPVTQVFANTDAKHVAELLNTEYLRGVMDGRIGH